MGRVGRPTGPWAWQRRTRAVRRGQEAPATPLRREMKAPKTSRASRPGGGKGRAAVSRAAAGRLARAAALSTVRRYDEKSQISVWGKMIL